MSSGGIFSLLSNNSESDTLFTASNYLRTRFERAALRKMPISVAFIEETHMLYTKTQYTPYVAIASEYKAIPVQKFGISNTTSEITVNIPSLSAHFLSDCVLHVDISPIGNKIAFDQNLDPTTTTPLYRYCAYPGIRLIEQASFNSSSVVIDSYNTDDVLAHRNFFVKNDYRSGWNKCYGHDEIQQATYNSKSFTGILNYSNGFQTPKLYHENLNLFIPLNFWFCEDITNSLILQNIASSQRNIKFKIASIDKIVQALVYNVNESQPPNITQIGTEKVALPINKLVANATLYINMLYTEDYVMNVIRSNVQTSVSLIRVHKQQKGSLTSGSNIIELRQLTYPGEYLIVGFRNKDNEKDFDRWHLMGSEEITQDVNHSKMLHVPAIVWNTEFQIRQLVVREAIHATSMNSVMNTIQLSTNSGIIIYPTLSTEFFNNYLPIRYNKNSFVVSPLDDNMFLITFSIYPGKFNPSGYFNFTTNKELILRYDMKGEFASIASNFEYIICMSALNFLKYDRNNNTDTLSLYISM